MSNKIAKENKEINKKEEKKTISNVPLILLVVIAYLLQILAYFGLVKNVDDWWAIGLSILASIILLVLNIVYALISIRKLNNKNENEEYDLKEFSKKALISKLILIPFYIVNFGLWMVITMGSLVVPGIIFVSIFAIIAAFIWTYGTMLATSAYSISTMYVLNKKNKMKTSTMVINCILQFFFVLDVIDYIIVYMKYRKEI